MLLFKSGPATKYQEVSANTERAGLLIFYSSYFQSPVPIRAWGTGYALSTRTVTQGHIVGNIAVDRAKLDAC